MYEINISVRKNMLFDGDADWAPGKGRAFAMKRDKLEAKPDRDSTLRANRSPNYKYVYGDAVYTRETKGNPLIS